MSTSQTPTINLPNGVDHPLTSPDPSPPQEIEATIARLSAYRHVKGVMVLFRRGVDGGGIVQSTGTVFEGENGQRYARELEGVVEGVTKAVGECDSGDQLRFMRIRTKRHELIITPDEKYVLVVLQDPGQ